VTRAARVPTMPPTPTAMTDLTSVALETLRVNGFIVGETDAMRAELVAPPPADDVDPAIRDLRELLWSSIDNVSSRDLDQIEVAEELAAGAIRIRVGIADVDRLVTKGSPIDVRARANGTSVYTGVAVYPMLPEALSTGLTSLNEGAERVVMVVECVVSTDGTIDSHDVYRARAVNRAKLAYETLGPWLEGRGPIPPTVATTAGLEDQLWLQDRAASHLKAMRERAGALEFDTVEATTVTKDGKVEAITVTRKNRARDLIEDFMVAANVAIAQYLAEQQRSAIRRVVRVPKRWSRIVAIAAQYGSTLPAEPDARALSAFLGTRRAADPLRFPDLSLSIVKLLGPGEYTLDLPGPGDDEGHFGLAAHDYSHATAPNRRYADLVTQRLVKAAIAGTPAPYTNDELAAIARQCTERENAANRVERVTRKAAAALLLAPRIGATFNAIVTGVNADGTYVRLLSPPAEGRVMRGEAGMDVGERVRVRLLSTDPVRGYIDFEGVGRDDGPPG
jgi:ribonuclease R